MGVKIVLADREPIGLALRRFRKLLEWSGTNHEMRCSLYFDEPTQVRQRKEIRRRLKTREATYLAKRAGEQ